MAREPACTVTKEIEPSKGASLLSAYCFVKQMRYSVVTSLADMDAIREKQRLPGRVSWALDFGHEL